MTIEERSNNSPTPISHSTFKTSTKIPFLIHGSLEKKAYLNYLIKINIYRYIQTSPEPETFSFECSVEEDDVVQISRK